MSNEVVRPEGLVDYDASLKPIPADWQPDEPKDMDIAEIHSLFFMRSLTDPIEKTEFRANDMKDLFRFGWYRTNLGVSIGKTKQVGSYMFDASLMPPIIAPFSGYAPCDYKEFHHSLNFFIHSKATEKQEKKLPKFMLTWSKEQIGDMRNAFKDAAPYLRSVGPPDLNAEYNLWMHNRHVRDVQMAHRVSALTWQIMSRMERFKGAKGMEIDAWCYIVALEMLHAEDGGCDRKLLHFVADRINDLTTLENFSDVGYQNYMLRRIFILYYLGEADAAWDTACNVSKLRGGSFTKSAEYDHVIECKEEPRKIAEEFDKSPKAMLTYFRL